MPEKKRAILVVSFGTSHPDTCEKTIELIENQIRDNYQECPVYRAWTSGRIRKKIEERDGVHIFSVAEALNYLKDQGIEEVIIQPTHVLNGIENERMEKEIKAAKKQFQKLAVGAPLLTTQEDSEKMVDMMIEQWDVKENEMLVFMGHGTEHHSNFVYAALNYQFAVKGHKNMVMGTVEGFPTIEDLIEAAKKAKPEKVILTPFMIVAGDHAKNDLAGDKEDSWKNMFEKEGFQTECVLKGLGEYEGARRLLLDHLAEAVAGIDQ